MQHRPGALSAGGSADGRRIVVPNNFTELRRVSEWVRRFAEERKLAHQDAYALELALNEALTNIMSYAYDDNAQHEIAVELHTQPGRIRVDVEDDGVPFNPLEMPIEERPETLDRSRPAGRGLPLMRSFMDELHYVRRESRNVLTMVMHWPKTSPKAIADS